jgi:hypothetical protein
MISRFSLWWQSNAPDAAHRSGRFLAGIFDQTRSQLAPILTTFVFFVSLGFYLYTLQPSLAWGDGAKLQIEALTGQSFIFADLPAAAFGGDRLPFARLGVAAWDHPLYVMLGYTLVRVFPAAHPPWIINTLSAFFGAGALTLLCWLCLTYTRSLTAALLATLGVAVSHTFWFHAVTPEVYTLFVFLLLASLVLYEGYEKTGRYAALFVSIIVLGLGASNHMLAFLTLPAILIYRLIIKDARPILTLGLSKLASLGLAFLIGFSPFLVQLARMLRVFPLAEVFGPVIGSVFLQELASMTPQIFLGSLSTYLLFLVFQFNPLALLLGGYGLLRGHQVAPSAWLKTLTFYGIYTLFGLFYRVTDQFAFFLSSHLFFGILIAFGISGLLSHLPAGRRVGMIVLLGLLTLSMPVLYGLAPQLAPAIGMTDEIFGIPQIGTGIRDGFAYYVNPNKRGDKGAYLFGNDFFTQAPQDTLVIAEWYTDTDEFFVLGYFSTVEALRPDIKIIGWPMENPFDFDANQARAVIDEVVELRPVYLASLSEEFYGAATLLDEYCIVPELNLYRVYPTDAPALLPPKAVCLASTGSKSPRR